jgi:hypothetical protein
MIPEDILERGRIEDIILHQKKRDFRILLLGYGHPDSALELRRNASETLRTRGFNVFIMRDFPSKPNEKLNDKFRRIIGDRNYSPHLHLVLVNQQLGATAVAYEISLLVERFGKTKASEIIRVCAAEGIDLVKSLSTYITELDEIIVRTYQNGNFVDMIEVMENTIIDAMT